MGRAMNDGSPRTSERVMGFTVMYATCARCRPAARSTASASGRRPMRRASATAAARARPRVWRRPRAGFVLRRALLSPDRLAVPLDLRVHRVAQTEALVAELVHELRLEHSL